MGQQCCAESDSIALTIKLSGAGMAPPESGCSHTIPGAPYGVDIRGISSSSAVLQLVLAFLDSGADSLGATSEAIYRAPSVVIVSSIGLRKLRVREPFRVILRHEAEEVSALDSDSGFFGIGDSEDEALRDLYVTLAQAFDALKEDADRLGPATREMADVLFARFEKI